MRLDLGATALPHTCVRENSNGDANTALLLDDAFVRAQRHVLSKNRGREESRVALVSATV